MPLKASINLPVAVCSINLVYACLSSPDHGQMEELDVRRASWAFRN